MCELRLDEKLVERGPQIQFQRSGEDRDAMIFARETPRDGRAQTSNTDDKGNLTHTKSPLVSRGSFSSQLVDICNNARREPNSKPFTEH
ncbi:MAG: hypothetical protein ABI871_01650 [Chthoniobacterales bacterium]